MNPADLPFGSTDLIAFWSGVQAFLAGSNPYDPQVLLSYQQSVLPGITSPQAFLNPPWTLPFLALLFWPSFEAARILWILFNCASVFLITLLSMRICLAEQRVSGQDSKRQDLLAPFLLAVSFVPALLTIQLGQLSLMVTLALVIGISALHQRRELLAGLAFLPLTLKPHLLIPLGIALLLYFFQSKNFRTPLAVLLGSIGLTAIALCWNIGILDQWLLLEFDLLNYQTATLATVLRQAIYWGTDQLTKWPTYLMPSIAAVIVILKFGLRPQLFDFEKGKNNLLGLIVLSLVFAPYAWPYDFSLLLIVQTILVLRSNRLLWVMLGLQIAFVATAALFENFGADFWYPIAMLCVL